MYMDTPTGMRDFNPDEMKIRANMEHILRNLFYTFGYDEIDTPAMEFIETLTKKGGEEIQKQIFKIEKEDIGLRFDLTVPLARYVTNRLDLMKPFKRFHIGKVWRNEEAQKGRYREFIQCDVDIIGVKSIWAEIELLLLAEEGLKRLGFNPPRENFLINDIEFLHSFAETYNVDDPFFYRTIDKFDKIGKEGVFKLLKQKFDNTQEIMHILFKKYSEDEKFDIIKQFNINAYNRMKKIKQEFGGELTLHLVRGLDYYTGPVFEVKLSNEIGSVIGGGRYDHMLELFGQKNYAVGLSFGFDRLYYLIKMQYKIKDEGVYVVTVGDVSKYVLDIVSLLRNEGIRTNMNFEKRSLKNQMEYAVKTHHRFVIIIGEREIKTNSITLKDLITGKQQILKRDEIVKFLK